MKVKTTILAPLFLWIGFFPVYADESMAESIIVQTGGNCPSSPNIPNTDPYIDQYTPLSDKNSLQYCG